MYVTLEFSPCLLCAATSEHGPGFLSPVCVGTAHCVLRQCHGGCHWSVVGWNTCTGMYGTWL